MGMLDFYLLRPYDDIVPAAPNENVLYFISFPSLFSYLV